MKDLNYPEFIGGNVSVEQAEKVRRSGMTNAQYLRAAIDFFDETRMTAYLTQKCNHIEECINVLKVYEQNLKNEQFNSLKVFDENLKDDDDSGSGVYKETTQTFKESEENHQGMTNLKGQSFKESEENLKGQENTKIDSDYLPIIDTLARLIANKGHLSDNDYSFQAGRAGKTVAELKQFIRENYDYLEEQADRYR